jgi:hypothetical protein
MANKRISDLSTATTLTLTDLLVLVNESQTRKTTISSVLSLIAAQEQFAELDENGKLLLSQIPDSLIGSVNYQGTWNGVATLDPAATANKGWYYVLSADSTTTVDGIPEWKTGDWIISNGTAWQKIDNSEAMLSFNGRTGAVVPVSGDYTTALVTEVTNLYYTGARVRAELLTGLSTSTSAIAASDSVLTAFGKAQGQIATKEASANKGAANGYAGLDSGGKVPTAQLPTTAGITEGSNLYYTGARVRAEVLTGLTTSTTAIAAADSILTAFGKAQGQIATKEATANKGVANGYAGLDSGGKVPTAQLPTTAGITEGSNLYYTGARVRAEVLTGLSTSTTAIAATDSVLTAFGKAQGQIATKEATANKGVANGYAGLDSGGKVPTAQLPTTAGITEGSNLYYTGTRVRAEVLTGLSTSNTAIVAADSVLAAFGKAQGQIAVKEATANKGVANGYAGLDSNGLLPKAQLTRGQKANVIDFTGYTAPADLNTNILRSYAIPAGTFASGDQLNLDVWINASNTAGTKKFAVYFGPNSNNFTGAVQVASYNVTTNALSSKFSRQFAFTSNTSLKAGIDASTTSQTGENPTAADPGISSLPSLGSQFYVIIAVTKSNAGDTAKMERITMTGVYQ